LTFKDFKEHFQKVPVEHYPHKVKNKPLVSVCVMTYQHKNYIKDCLDGILMQKTDFPFEILLGEDASTDGTKEVCLDYAQKYSDKIRLFLHKRENNIKYNGNPSGKFNFLYNLFNSKAEYIALCEGDDYWNDPYKLQKQVDILEQYNDLVMCTHETHHIHYPIGSKRTLRRAVSIIYSDMQLYGVSKAPQLLNDYLYNKNKFWWQARSHGDQKRKRLVHLEDMRSGKWFMSFCSILMKRKLVEPLPVCYTSTGGGHQLTLLLGAMSGGIYHLKEKMAVKRDQETSISKNLQRKSKINEVNKTLENNNRLKRFRCLKEYANDNQKLIFDEMIKNYIDKKKS